MELQKEQVDKLVEALKKDGYDFSVGIPMDTPIANAERVVSAGKGIGEKENMKLIEELAKQAGAAIGSSRPVAGNFKICTNQSLCWYERTKIHRKLIYRMWNFWCRSVLKRHQRCNDNCCHQQQPKCANL